MKKQCPDTVGIGAQHYMKEVRPLRRPTIKYAAALLLTLVLTLCMPLAAMAESTTSGAESGVVIATSPSEKLASITFSTANSKRVEVGRAVTLYVTMSNIQSSASVEFFSSDPSVAQVEKDGSDRCKVHGIKTGEVTITARVGSMEANYLLYVGDESVTAGGTTTTAVNVQSIQPGSIDYLSPGDESILQQYIADKKSDDAISYLIGVIGLAAIIGLSGLVLSVMFRNRSPKLNLYPGSRRRFNTGGFRGNQRKRLLPDQYYRNNKKY